MENESNNAPEFSEADMTTPEQVSEQPADTSHHNRVGVLLALLILLLILVLGGMYVWYTTAFQAPATPEPVVEREVPDMPNEPEMENADATVQQLNTVSTSNSLEAIEADIEATNLEELDAELDAIEAELEGM